jgi:small subunit ribosomal protein S3
MGQKVNPISFRLGMTTTWASSWYEDKNYAAYLIQDLRIRSALKRQFYAAGVSAVLIERLPKKVRITMKVLKPGMVIGRRGVDLDKARLVLQKFVDGEISINIVEVRRPELDATLVAEAIAFQLEKRVAFRRAMKKAVQSSLKMGAKGIKVSCAGRLGGAEIARTEWYREGRVPLHTLRANIDYGVASAFTTYGTIGVKVWIYKGDVVEGTKMEKGYAGA